MSENDKKKFQELLEKAMLHRRFRDSQTGQFTNTYCQNRIEKAYNPTKNRRISTKSSQKKSK